MLDGADPIETPETNTGVKYDSDKLEWDLLPFDEVEEVVEILTFGARKYSPDNWKRVPDAKRRYFNAMMRHIVAWQTGEQIDPESLKSHLAHAICNALFLMWFDNNVVDDAPPQQCSPDGIFMKPVELTTEPKDD